MRIVGWISKKNYVRTHFERVKQSKNKKEPARAEKFGQNYVRSAATSVDKSENSPQFS